MNQRKLNLELMRAILRSSSLDYDTAYPLIASISPQISSAISKIEREILNQKQKIQREKK